MKVPRKFANPVVSVLLFAGLWWTLEQLPVSRSTLGAFMHPGTTVCGATGFDCAVYRDGDKLRLRYSWEDTWPSEKPVATAWWAGCVWRHSGCAFYTRRTAGGELDWYTAPVALTDQEKTWVRAQFASAFETRWGDRPESHEFASFLRQGDITVVRTVYSGYLMNSALIAVFSVFLLSLAWVPEAWRRSRIGVRAYRLERAQCPNCAYDIRGLPDRQCPECGAMWTHDELEMAREKRFQNT
ncbi:MAG TPA: hypothetical protein VG797_07665 [Phycisphaerales bacterium]|nr:hypothetical protein [Phycisphaerales bacterium]